MTRPHDIWEFGWSKPYPDRDKYIQSLPEAEQEWATAVFHYIDMAFEYGVRAESDDVDWNSLSLDEGGRMLSRIRRRVKDRLEPPLDDSWKIRFKSYEELEKIAKEKENE